MLDLDLGRKKKQAIARVLPPIPETGWRPPTDFPNLSAASIIGFDVERKEYDFENSGPGWAKGLAHTVGFSIAAEARNGERGKWYFPIRHEVEQSHNLDPTHCLSWLKFVLETNVPKVGANLYYDVGSLTDDNIFVGGELFDVQFAEALLSSDGEVNLDWLGQKYLNRGKEINLLYAWCNLAYGNPKHDQRENIYRAPPRLVGPYGEADADMPLDIVKRQYAQLEREGLIDLFKMECGLIRLLVEMRIAGVTVDVDAAEQLYGELAVEITSDYTALREMTGVPIESVGSAVELGKAFDVMGIPYHRTAKTGKPSFKKEFLKGIEDDYPVAKLINNIREKEKIRSTFLRSYIIKGNVNGKIHCCFNQLRGDDDGTITGRFSSSDPNLQNIPIRTELGKKIRKIFRHDLIHARSRKCDYSQIEYRYLSHYAIDKGDGSAEALRQSYILNPKQDYHEATFLRLAPLMNWDTSDPKRAKELRRPVKNINFGLVYGMGVPKLARSIAGYFGGHLDDQQTKELFEAYHKANPYVKPTMGQAADEIAIFGFITTVLGRRTRFNLWVPAGYGVDRGAIALPYRQAIAEYGSKIKRAHSHKAINYRLQGSAADQIKKGMLDCYNSGIFRYTGVPRLQVHDELFFSDPGDSVPKDAWDAMSHTMETCIPLRVPIILDTGIGPNWGECE